MLFGGLGIGLLAVGIWGTRRVDQLGEVPSWDRKSVDRRKRVIRRGAYTCLVVGVLFVLISGISLALPPPGPLPAPPPPLPPR